MEHDGRLAPGGIVLVTVLGCAGVFGLPRLPGPWESSVHIVAALDIPVLIVADVAWGTVAGAMGLLALSRHQHLDRSWAFQNLLVCAALIAAFVVGGAVILGAGIEGHLGRRLLAECLGTLLPALVLREYTDPRGGRAWGDHGGRLSDGSRY